MSIRISVVSVIALLMTTGMFGSVNAGVKYYKKFDEIKGRAVAVDGGTLEVGNKGVRLLGVDAPEKYQRCKIEYVSYDCGGIAMRNLDRKIEGKEVVCSIRGKDYYWKAIAICTVNGEDLGHWLVFNGFAYAYKQHADAYTAIEMNAKAAKRGFWQGQFDPPWLR